MKIKIAAAVVIVGISFSSQAQSLIVGWGPIDPAQTSFPFAADYPNTYDATENYSGLTPENDSRGVWYSPNTSSTLNEATAPYLSWTVNLGSTTVTSPEFFLGGIGLTSNDTELQLSYSGDNYESSLADFSTADDGSYNDYVVSIPGSLTGTVNFKLYFYGGFGLLYNAPVYSFNANPVGTYSSAMGSGQYAAGLLGTTAVPEPSTLALVGVGGAAFLMRRRKK